MKKIVLALFLLCSLIFTSCSMSDIAEGFNYANSSYEETPSEPSIESEDESIESIDGEVYYSEASIKRIDSSSILDGKLADKSFDGGSTIDGGIETSEPSETGESTFQSGTLTAKEWCDNENWDFWTNLIRKNDWYQEAEAWNLIPLSRIAVTCKKGDVPVEMAQVTLYDGTQQVIWEAQTGPNGIAYLFYYLDGTTAVELPTDWTITATIGDETQSITWDGTDPTFDLQESKTIYQMDLMFMIDTTGSMSDELSFLQTELKSVINNVLQELGIDIRVSVNFYRDVGDTYVTRCYDFTQDLNVIQEELKKESADGGGDYPEAVHTALEEAIFNHSWNENNEKVLFLVLDAPAHTGETVQQSLAKSLKAAAKQGVHIIPVAASGVNTSCEVLLRTCSVLTNGTYVFLTDDSGYGDSHLEATIGDAPVETLKAILIRLITEYAANVTPKN